MTFKELSKERWPDLVTLFGQKGACGGCWCQWWRVERGGRLWEETKGAPARLRMEKLTKSGKAMGILAYVGDEPVGWCSFGPRMDFPRIETVKAYRRDDVEDVWCVNCYYVDREYRGKGMAGRLLERAIKAMKKRKVKVIEAYPVVPGEDGTKLAAAFSWTGPYAIFEKQGFKEIQRLAPKKPLVRLDLR